MIILAEPRELRGRRVAGGREPGLEGAAGGPRPRALAVARERGEPGEGPAALKDRREAHGRASGDRRRKTKKRARSASSSSEADSPPKKKEKKARRKAAETTSSSSGSSSSGSTTASGETGEESEEGASSSGGGRSGKKRKKAGATWALLNDIWPLEERPRKLQDRRYVSKLSWPTLMALQDRYEKEAEKKAPHRDLL